MKITAFAIFIFVLWNHELPAQVAVNKYPVQFGQYMNAHHMLNPASISDGDGVETGTGIQRNLGNWKNFATYYAYLSFDIPDKMVAQNNTLGIRFVGDQEGIYIQNSKLYLQYAWSTKINQWLNFSGGLDIGGYNFSVIGTSTTGNRSITNLDSDVGIWLFNQNFHLGIGASQVFNSNFQPFNEVLQLTRYYHLMGGYGFTLSDEFMLLPQFLYTFYMDRFNAYDVNVDAQIGDFIIIGGGFRNQRGVLLRFGATNIPLYLGKIEVTCAYNIPLPDDIFNVNTLEFGLKYGLYQK